MTQFTINYFYEDQWDATLDGEQAAIITAETLQAAIAEFRQDYGNHNILSAY